MKYVATLLLICSFHALSAQYMAHIRLNIESDTIFANEPILVTYCLAIEKTKTKAADQQEKISFAMIENGQFQRTSFSGQHTRRGNRIDSFYYAYLMVPNHIGPSLIPTGRFMRGEKILVETEKKLWVKSEKLSPQDSTALMKARRGNTDNKRYYIPPQVANTKKESPASLQVEKKQYAGIVGERLPIRYTLNRSSKDWIIPSLPVFRLMTITKGYSIRLSQGGSEYVETRTLHLVPQEKGTFELPACIAVFEGDSVRSERVRIIVE